MAAIVCDTGALIAIERGDRMVGALLAAAAEAGVEVLTSSTCVAQAWHDPARQARLVRALAGILERPLDQIQSRDCGLALACAGAADITDGAVAALARSGDTVLTSDPADIGHLLDAIGTKARVRGV